VIETIFELESVLSKQRQAPFMIERELYLQYMLKQGTCKERVRSVATILLHIIGMMNLNSLRLVKVSEIKDASQRWLIHVDKSRGRPAGTTTAYTFINIAMNWFRFHNLIEISAPPEQPFGQILIRFTYHLQITRKMSPETIRSYRYRVLAFLGWANKRHNKFSDISLIDVDAYLEEKRMDGWKPRSIASQCQALRTFFRYTELHCLSRPRIAQGIHSPTIPRHDSATRGPSWGDVRRLLALSAGEAPVDLRARAILLLCSIYGLRSSEVVNLTLSNFDWVDETLTVYRSKCGRVQQYPIQFEVGEAILRYLRKGRPSCSCAHVFVTLKPPYRPVSTATLWSLVAQRMERIGIRSQNMGPHSLRHACATQLLRKGSSLKEIAEFLGHRDITSVSIYAKYDVHFLHKVADFSLEGVR
jgi:integrase/recombinase XerD